jgi:hypothetical protein
VEKADFTIFFYLLFSAQQHSPLPEGKGVPYSALSYQPPRQRAKGRIEERIWRRKCLVLEIKLVWALLSLLVFLVPSPMHIPEEEKLLAFFFLNQQCLTGTL